jgi:hypothetical protein
MIVSRLAAFALGFVVVQATLRSAIRTVVVPRGEATRLTRKTFLVMRALYDFFRRRQRTAENGERIFARFGPTSLLVLALLWVLATVAGFVPMFWAAGAHDLKECLYLSGSSITTLGVRAPMGGFESALAYGEAIIGLGIVALLISYLPTIYTLFSRREAEVVKLDVRAGSPPTALEMLNRYQRIGWLERLDETWLNWEAWFSELEESHTSHPVLVFFRSQRPDSSWITCAGAVLDTTALMMSCLELANSPQAAVTLRSGFMALRAIAGFYGVAGPDDAEPNAPISIYREEFFLLFDDLAARGLPMKHDRHQAWRDFAGWRVNYDEPLLALCALCAAPPTPWSSDRIHRFQRPTLFHPRWRIEPPDTPPSW